MIEEITSLQNRWIKLAAGLKRKKGRDASGLFAAEGIRLAEEVLKADWRIEFCICSGELLENQRATSIVRALEQRGCPVYKVNKVIYDKVSDTKEPQGFLLAVEKRVCGLESFLGQNKKPMLIILDELQDPGNVGTIIRTADAAGCDGVVLLKGCADLFSGKVIRSAMGSIFHLPVATEVDTPGLLRFLAANEITLQVTAIDMAAKPYFQVDYTQATAVAFGNEGKGVGTALLDGAYGKIFIPMTGKAESLNVATATAVISYESLRQRTMTNSCDL